MDEQRTRIALDMSEAEYHSDPCEEPSLSSSAAQTIVLESCAKAWMRHPRLGGEPFKPTPEMTRGTLVHALLLGKGPVIKVLECDNWKNKRDQELRDMYFDAGKLATTRPLFDSASEAVERMRPRLAARGYPLAGHSEAAIFWREQASNGRWIDCRARLDHWDGEDLFDLKVTDNANPRKLLRGRMTEMGYHIQDHAYNRGIGVVCPELQGRTRMTFLFCEPFPPWEIVPLRCLGSLRELGSRHWLRAVDSWERCTRLDNWPGYTEGVILADAKPYELEEA